jgi:hypothetical protein
MCVFESWYKNSQVRRTRKKSSYPRIQEGEAKFGSVVLGQNTDLLHKLFQEFISLRAISGKTQPRIPELEACVESRDSSSDIQHIQRWSNSHRSSSSHTSIASIIQAALGTVLYSSPIAGTSR